MDQYGKALEDRVRKQAKDIRENTSRRRTTDFALLCPWRVSTPRFFGARASRIRSNASIKVTLAGPTTLAAILNSLQMGFRTLAIEQRSGEVWRLLGAVKTDFSRFGDLLARTKKQLDSVSNTLADAEVRTRSIERKLRGVEALPEAESAQLLSQDSRLVIDLEPDAEDDPGPPSEDGD